MCNVNFSNKVYEHFYIFCLSSLDCKNSHITTIHNGKISRDLHLHYAVYYLCYFSFSTSNSKIQLDKLEKCAKPRPTCISNPSLRYVSVIK